jgi:hypothetical protein
MTLGTALSSDSSGGGVMRTIDDDSAHWRQLAASARAKAARMIMPEAQRGMIEIAVRYDVLADLAERRGGAAEN